MFYFLWGSSTEAGYLFLKWFVNGVLGHGENDECGDIVRNPEYRNPEFLYSGFLKFKKIENWYFRVFWTLEIPKMKKKIFFEIRF